MEEASHHETGIVAIDTETTGQGGGLDIRDGTAHATGMSLCYRGKSGLNSFYLPFRHGDSGDYKWKEFQPLIQYILDNSRVIFHNAKFDLVSLRTFGADTSKTRFYDTMIMAHMIDENLPFSGKGLDSLAKYYLKDPGKAMTPQLKSIIKTFGWEAVTSKLMAEYGAKDAELTYRLFEFLKPKFDEEMDEKVWEHKEQFIRVLMGMELKGVRIDQQLSWQQAKIGRKIMADIQEDLGGLNPASPKDLKYLLIDQLGLPIITHPKTKKMTFNKDAMIEYEEVLQHISNPTAQKILEFRGWQKTVSSNYDAYLRLVGPDGRLRCNYRIDVARTGRLSCRDPNLQQIPRTSDKAWNGKLKAAFISEKGFNLWDFDYGQLEFRLASAYAGEKELLEAFNDPDRDVFTEMAARLRMTRQDVKTLNYSIQYGAGVTRISNVFGLSASAAKNMISNYYAEHPAIRRMSNKVKAFAEAKMFAPLWSGRRRHVLNKSDSYKMFNSVIQGGAADIVEYVMVRLYNEVDSNACRLLLTVHDSVVFEIRDDVIDEMRPKIIAIMEDVEEATGVDFGVKFAVDCKKWGE